jgi:hypothetical protein
MNKKNSKKPRKHLKKMQEKNEKFTNMDQKALEETFRHLLIKNKKD